MKWTAVLFTLFLIGNAAIAQPSALSTKSKKAAALYVEADNYRVRGQYIRAIDLLEEAISKDKKFFEAYFRLAVIYKSKGELTKAEDYLNQVLELNSGNNAPAYFELGELYQMQARYKESIESIKKYLAYNPRNSKRVDEAQRILKNAAYALDNAEVQAAFTPLPLSDTVNAFPMQYFPVVSVDESFLLFTRRLGTTSEYDEDLVICYQDENGNWLEPQSLSDNINSQFNEGTCTISADGSTLIFTSCYGRNGFGSCDLYVSNKTGDVWSRPENLGGTVNSSAWDSQPSLSADGRTLYFISNRRGGIGGRDIWYTEKDDSDNWTKPKNIGPSINTVNEEVSPFIHPNNRTLYYSTNGLPGFGGFDLYYSHHENGNWMKANNIGAPINNAEDQVSLFITSSGKKGYYSNEDSNSDKKGIIYEFDLEGLHEIKYQIAYVQGVVTDIESKEPLKAEIELFDIKSNKRVSLVNSDSITGKYLMVLTEGSEYALYINKQGYLFSSNAFTFRTSTDQAVKSIVKNIELEKIKKGVSMDLRNIFFETDEYEIKPESFAEIDKLIRFLMANPSITIEISGHTDNVGSNEYNLSLSRKRAASVANYIFNKSIALNRVVVKGFGDSQPISSNETDEGRQLNRRIELKIVKF